MGLQNLCWGFESFCPCHFYQNPNQNLSSSTAVSGVYLDTRLKKDPQIIAWGSFFIPQSVLQNLSVLLRVMRFWVILGSKAYNIVFLWVNYIFPDTSTPDTWKYTPYILSAAIRKILRGVSILHVISVRTGMRKISTINIG